MYDGLIYEHLISMLKAMKKMKLKWHFTVNIQRCMPTIFNIIFKECLVYCNMYHVLQTGKQTCARSQYDTSGSKSLA